MTAKDPALQAFLRQQAADYRAGLPARLAGLEAALEAWAQAPSDTAMHELERCAHGIAGSAATFGLRALGETARALEEACEQSAPAVPQLAHRLCEHLRQEIAAG